MRRTRGEAERIMRGICAKSQTVTVETFKVKTYFDPVAKKQVKRCSIEWRKSVVPPRKPDVNEF